jgi:PAS domain S-box-containing protein
MKTNYNDPLNQIYQQHKARPASINHYLVAVILVGIGIIIDFGFMRISSRGSFLIFFAAVNLSAWYGGIKPGLLAMLLSALACNYFFIPPTYSLDFTWDDIAHMGMFAQIAILTSLLSNYRKKTTDILKAGQDLFQSFMNMSPAFAFIKDDQGNYIYANESLSKFFEKLHFEWQGKTDYDIWPAALARKFSDSDQKVLKTGETLEEIQMISIGPEKYYWIIFRFLIKDVLDRNLIAGIAVDITERRQIELELEWEKKHSTAIINNSPSMIFRLSPEGIIKFINPTTEQITSYSQADLIGRNWWEVFYPGEAFQQGQELHTTIKQGNVYNVQSMITTRDGNQRIILWNWTHRLDETQQEFEIIGFGRDITTQAKFEKELKQSLNNLQKVKLEWERTVDALQEMVLLINSDRCVVRANKTVERWGIKSVKQISDQDVHTILHAGCKSPDCYISAVINEAMQNDSTNLSVYREEMDEVLQRHIAITCTRINPKSPELIDQDHHSYVLILRDTTNLHALQQVAKRRDRFEAMEYMVGRLAHQIGNPLAAMKTTAQVWQRNFDKLDVNKQSEYLSKIIDRIKHLEYIISRILTGKGWKANSESRELMRLSDMLKNIQAMFNEVMKEKQVNFIIIDPAEEIVLWGNPKAVEEVMINIVKNALEACKPGDKITIASSAKNSQVIITVKDSGMGMSKSTLEHIFMPFYTTKSQGTGIGLSHTNYLMEQLDGQIDIKSKEGAGTIVELTFKGEKAIHFS